MFNASRMKIKAITAKKQENAEMEVKKDMNIDKLINNIPDIVFSRKDIFDAAYNNDNNFRESQMRFLIEKLLRKEKIMRISRNHYIKAYNNIESGQMKECYSALYSNNAEEIINELKTKYPYIKFQVWELGMLNEFVNHLISQNLIFIEVENDACEFVYSYLKELGKKGLLLKPTDKELTYYVDDNAIIINRLISETPQKNNSHEVLLEKIIVDLFANKLLNSILSKGDYPEMLERMFEKYKINQVMLFRYARRRNKEKEIFDFIKDKTNINLISEV